MNLTIIRHLWAGVHLKHHCVVNFPRCYSIVWLIQYFDLGQSGATNYVRLHFDVCFVCYDCYLVLFFDCVDTINQTVFLASENDFRQVLDFSSSFFPRTYITCIKICCINSLDTLFRRGLILRPMVLESFPWSFSAIIWANFYGFQFFWVLARINIWLLHKINLSCRLSIKLDFTIILHLL